MPPPQTQFSFSLQATDPSGARAGEIITPHGKIETPIFMPVGTHATVKAMTPEQIRGTKTQILLSNTYHLHLQPGADLVSKFGGLHQFMSWDGPILTDSGGFQVFSIPGKVVDDDGVTFPYAKKGNKIRLTPENSMEIQNKLGADIIMAFDECVEFPVSRAYAETALNRTAEWAKRCKKAHNREDQTLFAISQGATFKDLRAKGIEQLMEIGFPGYAIGGLAVGESADEMKKVLDYTTPLLPKDKPRYLMGVGLPEDILEMVERGVDMSDCVIPTKYARSGVLFTNVGKLRITNGQFKKDKFPVDTNCHCYTCSNFSRGYLNHLFAANEILGATLTSIHNVHFYLNLMSRIRTAIQEGQYSRFKADFLALYFRNNKNR